MTLSAPPIDARTAVEVERQLVALIKTYAPEWNQFDPAAGSATGLSGALAGVFSRFAELTIQRLNQAPEKNQLAFLDMLGATPLSPQAARAPLTFSLAAGARGAVAPARTQVAAAPNPDQPQGVLFETERELAVTPARLARIVGWDARQDRLSEQSRAADVRNVDPVTLFLGDTSIDHAFYLGQDEFFGFPEITGFSVTITLAEDLASPFDPRQVQWELWDGQTATPVHPSATGGVTPDGTADLTTSGKIWFLTLPQIPPADLAGRTTRWLRCRLLTPITTSATPVPGFVRASQLPTITDLVLDGVGRGGSAVLPDSAFLDSTPLDVSKDFYPFGFDARFGATWHIASRQVLSIAGRQIGLYLIMTDPTSGLPRPSATTILSLKWEYWTDEGWTEIGTSSYLGGVAAGSSGFFDLTKAITGGGAIGFVLNKPPRPTAVNGVENYWLRVRIAGGGYVPSDATPPPVAPSLAEARLYYDNSNRAVSAYAPDALARGDGVQVSEVSMPFSPFIPAPDRGRSTYFGLSWPSDVATPPQAPISLYVDLAETPFGRAPDDPAAISRPQLAWSYWNGAGWRDLAVADDTEGLTKSEGLRFLPPADMAAAALFGGPSLYWVRAAWIEGDYKFLPRPRRILLNTVMAEQATTVRDERLGSSSGVASQSLTAAQTPILDGVVLEVVEPEWPPASERGDVLFHGGADGIVAEPGGGVRVRWREVTDFHGSGPRDRHFVLDHQTGVIKFGDGVAGLIPPRGSGNLRLTAYRTGVGGGGNVPEGAITQLKTTLPYVDKVTNLVAATGGVGGEDLSSLRERAPRLARHGGRAVTAADFEDLARLASAEVARALCVPLHDLSVDPDSRTAMPGLVSVIVAPRSQSGRPAPGVQLVERTQAFLRAAALPSATVVVVGPEYVTVDVRAEVNLSRLDGAAAVSVAMQAALAAFLHPLTGGLDAKGWDFGRRPHKSDLYRLLQAVDGVDHVAALEVTERPDRTGAIETGRFLVCSGVHRIDLTFGSR